MAFTSGTQWDVRSGGSDSNGGGFDTSTSGTDYSQQNSPQISYTDLVIGTTTTQCTSAAHPFTSAHVGNIINITSGTGFTVQRVQVTSVSGSTATCDKSLGTASSTGGVGNLGGSLATVGTAAGLAVNQNTIWLQNGTYTITSSITISTATNLIGYGSTHGDLGTRPTITTSTNSVNLVSITQANNTYCNCMIQNINFSSTAGTPGNGIGPGTYGVYFAVNRCAVTGCAVGIGSTSYYAYGVSISQCEIYSNTSWGVYLYASVAKGFIIADCYIHGNGGSGTGVSTGGAYLTTNSAITMLRCIFNANAGIGAEVTSSGFAILINDCDFVGTTGTGSSSTGAGSGVILQTNSTFWLDVSNNIFYNNAGYGIWSGQPLYDSQTPHNNAYGANTLGARGNGSGQSTPASSSGDVTLTVSPFNTDFTLNSTAGGGAACKGVGWPGAYPGAAGTGYKDMGALQSNGSSGGGSSSASPMVWVSLGL